MHLLINNIRDEFVWTNWTVVSPLIIPKFGPESQLKPYTLTIEVYMRPESTYK